MIVTMTNCAEHAYWIGYYQNEDGTTLDINNAISLYANTASNIWDSHTGTRN